MSSSPITSLNALINKAASLNSKPKLAPLESVECYQAHENQAETERLSEGDNRYRLLGEKLASFLPATDYQQHALHYVLKGLGYLPDSMLEALVSYLGGPTSKQYLNANAHLRLIIAVNIRLKTPLQLSKMQELRQRFAADAVAMQDPKVWQQASSNKLSNLKLINKSSDAAVNWHDKTIANADDGDMTIRCYQAGVHSKTNHNLDETVMLFFHGGGFCIGDVDTHHEFCHRVCAQTGWAVVSVDYRLAPEHAAPAALQDAIKAYAWLAKNSQDLGASPSRIVLAGDSAGGGLSTLLAQQLTHPTEEAWSDLGIAGQHMYKLLKTLPRPLAQMPLYPVTDIETDYPSWELYGEGLLLDHADVAVFDAAFMQNSPLPREHVLISPMIGDNSKVCPTYIVASEFDVLRDEAFAYAEQLKAAEIAVETYAVLGAPHGFVHLMSVHSGLEQQTQYIINDFARFVDEIISSESLLVA
ncbi:alpha/beta hydrolase [Psychrobacter sp. 1U2]|uniref:alpha/beta hydrolase n=1 Tax=Psychrobacter sp. 1U2 TaxID=3453577 RepID=UPI003F472B00